MARKPDPYRDGLADWFQGRDTLAAEAAGSLLAETLIRVRLYLEAKQTAKE